MSHAHNSLFMIRTREICVAGHVLRARLHGNNLVSHKSGLVQRYRSKLGFGGGGGDQFGYRDNTTANFFPIHLQFTIHHSALCNLVTVGAVKGDTKESNGSLVAISAIQDVAVVWFIL